MPDAPRYWFPAKRYGWGWGPPLTWQGWVVTIAWIAAFTVGSAMLALRSVVAFAAFTAVMLVLIIAICWITGEPPRWRWGDDD